MLNAENRWSKGRGYKQYTYTIKDIAELADISISRVRHLISDGKLTPTLKGIISYINPKQ